VRLGNRTTLTGGGVARALSFLEIWMTLSTLQKTIERIHGGIHGEVGVCVQDIGSGEVIGVNLDTAIPMASVCKSRFW